MSIQRKQFVKKNEKKDNLQFISNKKVKRGLKIELLLNAIIDGQLIASVEDEIIINRWRNSKNTLSICTIKQIDKDGLVHTWDETIQQWFAFHITKPPEIVKIYSE